MKIRPLILCFNLVTTPLLSTYAPGDVEWDAEADDWEDVEGGGYIDSSKAGRDPHGRTSQ